MLPIDISNYEFFKQIVERIDEAVFVVEAKTGEILYVNKKTCENLQYDFEELIGVNIEDIRRPMLEKEEGYWRKWSEQYKKFEETPRFYSYGLHVRKDGSTFPVETSINLLEFNGIQYVAAFSRDITARSAQEEVQRQLEEALIRSFEYEVSEKIAEHKRQMFQEKIMLQQSKMATLGEMIGAITHQLKQPLNAIGLISDSLLDCAEPGTQMYACLEEPSRLIRDEVDQMGMTIRSFRNFFKPSIHKEEFFIHEAVRNTCHLVSPIINSNGIALDFAIEQGMKYTGYINEFKELVMIMLANAKDAIVENNIRHGKVYIEGYSQGGKYILKVIDNGGGITEELLPDKVFDSYISTKPGGTGVGLYIAKLVVEKMSGTIEAQNSGDGAAFIVEIPQHNEVPAENQV